MNKIKIFFVSILFMMSLGSLASAQILYDGADTTGVTTDDIYIIDYDQTSSSEVTLQFGGAANYFRFNTVSGDFEISSNLDLGSNQLVNARLQNVAVLGDVPSCSAVSDRGKKIFVGGSNISGVNGAQTLEANKEYICNNSNPAATRWVASTGGDADTLDGLDSGQFLRSDTSDNYTSGTLTFDSGTSVVFNTDNVTLSGSRSNSFTVNNDAADGDNSTLVFGDGTGTILFNDTTGIFNFSNSINVNGTTTTNNLVVNSSGNVDFNLNELLEMRLENVSSLPTCNAASIGRKVYLTVVDGTNPIGEYVCDGTNWVKDSVSGTNFRLSFSPVYKDAVSRPDGTNNVGTLSVDYDETNRRNFYRWRTNNGSLQDIDLVVDIRLPEDFGSFQTTPISFDLRSNTTLITDQQVDVTGNDTAGVAMTLTGAADLVSTVANTWDSKNIGITGGTFTAGQRMQLVFKLQSRLNSVQRPIDLGNLRINYVRK